MQKVLSIDGGGIRGIIPAMVLAEIERRTGKRTAEMFDLIAGTSTGGILALGLTKPGQDNKPEFSAKRLIELYENEGGKIFSIPVWHRIQSAGGVLEEKYPSDGIEEVAKRYFGDVRLADAYKEVLVTAYEIEKRSPWFFKRRHAKDPTKKGYNHYMREVARATSAAPTYFEPLQLEVGPEGELAFIDGGVHSNNPAMCAYVEALKIHPEERDFLVVSLGTGELTRNMPYEEVKGWGLALWAQPILNVVFDGVADTVDYQLKELLSTEEGEARRYYRFQTVLDIGKDDMDDASRTNIAALKTKAREIIAENDAALTSLCAKLTA
ncbi:MAG TPA: patatin-like phospholipase family protein [Rubrobacter sp.]|nr:patatin-like phospholipase family protein [Rubrobacter sp.]